MCESYCFLNIEEICIHGYKFNLTVIYVVTYNTNDLLKIFVSMFKSDIGNFFLMTSMSDLGIR